METKNKNFFQSFWQGLQEEKNNFAFGKYYAKVNLEYKTIDQIIQTDLNFWVIPRRIILIFCIFVIISLVGIKKYNRWIIKRNI